MISRKHYGGPIGPPAMINCELRQARKGATVAIDSCAGMWLVGPPPNFKILVLFGIFIASLLIFIANANPLKWLIG